MEIRDIAVIGSGAMGQTIASLLLDKRRYDGFKEDPKFRISLWEYDPSYYTNLEKILGNPSLYGNLNNIFFNFGDYRERVNLFHPTSEKDYKKSLEESIEGKQLIIIATSTKGLGTVCESISDKVKPDTYVPSLCKGVIENTNPKIKPRLITPYEVMEYSFPEQVKIAVGGGGNISKEIRDFKETIFTIFSDRFNPEDMRVMKELFTVKKFTAKEGYNRLLNEMLWASKNPYAIGAGILDTLEDSRDIMGDYVAAVLREVKSIYKKIIVERFSRLKLTKFGRDFINEGVIADLLATCYSKDSRNFRTGKYLAEGKNLAEINSLLEGQVAEGIPSTRKLLNLFKNPEIEVPILYGISEVISGEKTARDVHDYIINLLREYQKIKLFNHIRSLRKKSHV